jgi:Nucleotide-diphospho-sugar transferase
MAEVAGIGRDGRGVVYIATGAAHVEAARQSALSVRATNPDLGIALFSDVPAAGPGFDRVEPIAEPHLRSKVDYLPRTPFAETLYLDTDTRVLGPLDDLFDVLERFDLALAQRAYVRANRKRAVWRHVVPAAFPEHNGGVLLYRASPAAIGFLEAWKAAYAEAGFGVDQITLRELLWSSDLRYAVLPARYNRRRWSWWEKWTSRHAPPLILHINRFHPTRYGPLRRRLAWLEGPMR